MSKPSLALGMLAAAVLATGLATQSGARPAVERVTLSATRVNAGQIGQAFLVPRAQNTDVTIQVSGVPNAVLLPVRLHVFIHQGSCSSPSAEPAYRLTSRVVTNGNRDGVITLRNTVPVSLDTLHAGAHALVVRSSPASGNQVLFCGELRAG
jgi:hypothetical protein